MLLQNNSDMTRTHKPCVTSQRRCPLDQCFNLVMEVKTDHLCVPALPIIVLCYWSLFIYVFHIIAFDS